MDHHFNINLAEKYGVDEAIMLNHLFFWIMHNEANNKNYYDGHYWTFNSIAAFEKLFPYWTKKQIERVLKSLEKNELIITGNYNKSTYDRTKWYSIPENIINEIKTGTNKMEKCILPNEEMDLPNEENGFTKMVEPIPYINTDNKTQIENKKEKGGINAIIASYTTNRELIDCIKDFIKMRAAKKKPVTDRALKMLFKELDRLESTDERKIKVLEQSIMNCWQGVFPLKDEKGGGDYDSGSSTRSSDTFAISGQQCSGETRNPFYS